MVDIEYDIREATPKDSKSIGRIYNSAIIQGSHYSSHKEDALLFPNGEPPEKLTEKDSNVTYVIENKDKIIAWSSLNLEDKFLDGLFVDPDYQSMGLGSVLVRKVESEAQKRQFDRIWIASDPEVVSYYTSKDYKIVKDTKMKGINQEKEVECVILSKSL